jgi:CxxC motif-containing protein (DUF1111 family)
MNEIGAARIGKKRRATFAVYGRLAAAISVLVAIGCSAAGSPPPADPPVGVTSQAVTSGTPDGENAFLVSGTVRGSNGQPLAGVTLTLAGAVQISLGLPTTTTTNALGYYSFGVVCPGGTNGTGSCSVSVQPSRTGTAFTPTVANLNATAANVTANFTANVAGAAVTVAIDPGVRTGNPGAGAFPALTTIAPTCTAQAGANNCPVPTNGCFPGLASEDLAFCENAFVRFQEVDSVSGNNVDGPNGGSGLGPTFNANGCATCHAQPAVGGSSPGLTSPQRPVPNPQVAEANLDGATNSLAILPFITATGPVREVRFASDSGVHDIFTIAGRSDAPGCTAAILPQPNFAANTLGFRIPTPTFGLGLVENVTENALQANLDAAPAGAPSSASLGITGFLQHSGNDGTITRFGWKAQNKSLLIFAGEAYNVESGVSNENFPDERGVTSTSCVFNGGPEDVTNTVGPISNGTTGTASDMSSDITDFAAAMRLSAPPKPAPAPFVAGATTITAAEVATGSTEFIAVGCGNCHSPTLVTESSGIDDAMNNVTFHPYSDFAVHTMGTLADVATQGAAGPNQFRSAPLWGVGQRIFFLHDGRTSDLVAAIQAHSSSGSEASAVIARFNALSVTNQQDVIDFLRSL